MEVLNAPAFLAINVRDGSKGAASQQTGGIGIANSPRLDVAIGGGEAPATNFSFATIARSAEHELDRVITAIGPEQVLTSDDLLTTNSRFEFRIESPLEVAKIPEHAGFLAGAISGIIGPVAHDAAIEGSFGVNADMLIRREAVTAPLASTVRALFCWKRRRLSP